MGYNANGKANIVLNCKDSAYASNALRFPCGRCIGCQLRRAREWSIRCMHESRSFENNCFLTLTYDDEHLPERNSIEPYDFQCFMKRLRFKVKRKLRYFHCGEYGKKLGRPHYHCILFGYNFPDRKLLQEKPFKRYRSAELESLWDKGFSMVCDLTAESAAYVARYSTKKKFGDEAASHYGDKHPEYVTMSVKPGLGYEWYKKFRNDLYPGGFYVYNGYKIAIPKYYDKLYEKEDPEGMKKIKLARLNHVKYNRSTVLDVIEGESRMVDNNDLIRLDVRERVKLSQIRNLKRTLEELE